MPRVSDPVHGSYESGALTDLGTSHSITISVTPGRQSRIMITSFFAERTDGSATTWAPLVRRSSSDSREAFSYAAAAVGTTINDSFDPPVPLQTDASGNIYFASGFDAGSDNDAEFRLHWYVVNSQ